MALKIEQLSFFPIGEQEVIEDKINELQTKIKNLRSGLFKRYSEMERAIEFLESELEDLVKANLERIGI